MKATTGGISAHGLRYFGKPLRMDMQSRILCLRTPSHISEVQNCAYAHQPNWAFNVDANSGHAFGILLAAVGALRPFGAPAPVN
jgi:hypothetical protein